jgi:hypothetical protein
MSTSPRPWTELSIRACVSRFADLCNDLNRGLEDEGRKRDAATGPEDGNTMAPSVVIGEQAAAFLEKVDRETRRSTREPVKELVP